MEENPASGLVMLEAGVPVVVTGEEDHQAWLARYPVQPGGQRRVVVGLAWCTIGSGEYRGQYAIEVRLDGQRIGELTYLMSRRYADIMGQVIEAGGVPVCEAVIRVGDRGLEVVLYLPRDASGVVVPPRTAVFTPPAQRKSRRPVWIAVGAVVLLFVVIGAFADETPSTRDTAAALTTTATSTTTTATVPTTTVPTTTTTTTITTTATTTTTTTAAPAPNPQPNPEPKPQPNPQPNPQPAPETQASPPPAPNPGCHPSYDPCVPIASDVDCKPGKGNGPLYVTGPIRVIGPDEYELDADHDGTGCE